MVMLLQVIIWVFLFPQNQFIFQVADQDSVEIVLEHPYASSHPHSFTAIQVSSSKYKLFGLVLKRIYYGLKLKA